MTDPNLQDAGSPAAPTYRQADVSGYGQPQPGQPAKYNVLAIVSLVTAFFVSLAAIITGHIALNQIKRTGEQGRGLAIAGLVLGYVGFIGGLIVTIIVSIIFLVVALSNPGAFTTSY